MKFRTFVLAGACVAAMSTAGYTYAQDAAVPATASEAAKPAADEGIVEVVVTAEKRKSSVQKTAISMEVLTSADIQKRGITDISTLANSNASVNLQMNTGVPVLAIRGVSSSDTTDTGDPAVSVATDGVFLNRNFSLFAGMYDVDRVEILRGPQGTLYGRNSTGGTLNVISAQPNLNAYSSRIAVDLGNYNKANVDGYINVPLTDNLGMRASFASRRHDGYRSNPVGVDLDDEDTTSARVQFLYKPTSDLTLWTLFQYSHLGGAGAPQDNYAFTYPTGGGAEPVHEIPAGAAQGDTVIAGGDNFLDASIFDFKYSIAYDGLPGGSSVTYLGSFNRTKYLRGGSPFSAGAPNTFLDDQRPDTINQEIRFASGSDSFFKWQFGAFYFSEVSAVNNQQWIDYRASSAYHILTFDFPEVKTESKAVFAQGSFDLSDTLKLTTGARYTEDTKSRIGTFFLYPFNLAIDQSGSASSNKVTWMVGLDKQLTPRNLLYGKVSTGYKAGGFTGNSQYRPETVTAYELGSKNKFFGNKLQLNLAAYQMEYRDQQVSQFVAGASSSGASTTNAGSSKIYGIEGDIVAIVDPIGRFDLSATLQHARYEAFIQSAGWSTNSEAVNLDLAGNHLPLSPDQAFTVQWEKDFLNVFGGTLTPRINFKYSSKVYFAPTNFDSQLQKAYSLVDLGLDYVPNDGDWQLQFYVKNVGDKTILSNADEFYLNGNYTYSYQPPRTYGVRLTASFR